MFFNYRQNNSGGSFVEDKKLGIGINVWVEAPNAARANAIAQTIGIYFNGCDSGRDCSCCGDRWYSVDDADGTEEPTYYGKPLIRLKDDIWKIPKEEWSLDWGVGSYIHFADGRIVRIAPEKKGK